MSKVINTYWDNTVIAIPARRRNKTATTRANATPQWFIFTVIVSITFMLCLAINFRAFAEMNAEHEQNGRLTLAVGQLTEENAGLQTELQDLKTDSHAIEREARKMGLSRPNEKVFVPMN